MKSRLTLTARAWIDRPRVLAVYKVAMVTAGWIIGAGIVWAIGWVQWVVARYLGGF